MAKGLLQVVGSEAECTAEMIMLVDNIFDCLIVTNCSEGIGKKKPRILHTEELEAEGIHCIGHVSIFPIGSKLWHDVAGWKANVWSI